MNLTVDVLYMYLVVWQCKDLLVEMGTGITLVQTALDTALHWL